MSLLTFDHRIAGIPCQIKVTYFHHQPPFRGSPHQRDSDMDYYGHTELEYNVLDSKGRLAGSWLEKKINKEEKAVIEQTASELLTGD